MQRSCSLLLAVACLAQAGPPAVPAKAARQKSAAAKAVKTAVYPQKAEKEADRLMSCWLDVKNRAVEDTRPELTVVMVDCGSGEADIIFYGKLPPARSEYQWWQLTPITNPEVCAVLINKYHRGCHNDSTNVAKQIRSRFRYITRPLAPASK